MFICVFQHNTNVFSLVKQAGRQLLEGLGIVLGEVQ